MKQAYNFFAVLLQADTWKNMLYVLLSFPLGVLYFVFLVTGWSLGLGLLITWFGIPILFGTLLLARVFARCESDIANLLLGTKITYTPIKRQKGIWKQVQQYMCDAFTWKSCAYLLMKFPLGILSFVLLVTLLSVSMSLFAAPFFYYLTQNSILQGTLCITPTVCLIRSYMSAYMISLLGVVLFFVSLHALNGIAYLSGLLTTYLLK